MQTSNFFKRAAKVVLYGALLLLPLVAWFNRYAIYDWVRLRNYSPSPQVQALSETTTMTSSARRIFYANHPRIEPKDQLRADCKQNEFTIVLGCYVAGQGIFLFDVSDPRLSGVEEVTAAHEMLHAGYDRLSGKERTRINSLLEQTFASLDNERIKQTIEQYRQKDPAIVPNELHSILGTEYRNLPAELEEYYQQYFKDRMAVVAFSERYESEFSSRQSRVKSYDAQMESLRAEIEANQSRLTSLANNIQVERAKLNALATSDTAAYNAAVPIFNQQIDVYNNLASATQKTIDEYNALVAQRNALAVEINDLTQAIDTRPQGIPTQ